MDKLPVKVTSSWLETAGIAFIAALVYFRYASLDMALFWDEYYHLLAARSWANDGTLRIAEGYYPTHSWFTVTYGSLFKTLGESIFVAKAFSATVATIWAVAVFAWTRSVAGRFAGWLAALLFCLSPLVLDVTGMIRFYGVQGLLFWLGVVASFSLLSYRHSRYAAGLLGLAAVLCLGLGVAVTPLTTMGLIGLLIWVAALASFHAVRIGKPHWVVIGLFLAVICVAVVSTTTGVDEEAFSLFRWTPIWALDRADDLRWYHALFKTGYPTFWTLFPLAALLAIGRAPRAAWLCTLVFATAFLLGSFAAAKAERYIAYVMPFFFVVWAIALAEVVPQIRRTASSILNRLTPTGLGSRFSASVGAVLTFGICAFVVLSNSAFPNTYRLLSGSVYNGVQPSVWDAASDTLGSLSATADVIVTPNSLQTLYHDGRYDIEFRGTVVAEVGSNGEFGIDRRTGRPAISTAESLRKLMACYANGLVFAERWRWRHPTEGITDEAANLLESAADTVPLPWAIVAMRWTGLEGSESSACNGLPPLNRP